MAGLAALASGFQAGSLLVFHSPWARPIPWLVGLCGVGCLVAAAELSQPRHRAPALAGLLLGPLALGGGAWSFWIYGSGFRSLLLPVLPLFAAVAGVLVALSARDIRQVAYDRDALRRELEALLPPDEPRRPRTRPWIYAAAAALALLIGVPIYSPGTLDWLGTRARGVAAGHGLRSDGFAATRKDFPYPGSPLAWYLDTEGRYTAVPKRQVLELADGIARDVGWRLAAATGVADPVLAEQRLWEQGRQRELPLWIAAALRDLHVFYHEEALFSRSFNPDAHFLAEEIHMDCDQLVWVFLHVAYRLDLGMTAVPSPMHVYLRYAGPGARPALYVETTQFRNVIVDDQHIDMRGPAIGESFFIDADYYPSGRGRLVPTVALAAAAGLFQPWSERGIRDAMLGEVLQGVKAAGLKVDVIAEAEKQVQGSRDITLVANLYQEYVARAKARAAAQDKEGARADALRARQLRADYGPLVIIGRAVEEDILDGLEE